MPPQTHLFFSQPKTRAAQWLPQISAHFLAFFSLFNSLSIDMQWILGVSLWLHVIFNKSPQFVYIDKLFALYFHVLHCQNLLICVVNLGYNQIRCLASPPAHFASVKELKSRGCLKSNSLSPHWPLTLLAWGTRPCLWALYAYMTSSDSSIHLSHTV